MASLFPRGPQNYPLSDLAQQGAGGSVTVSANAMAALLEEARPIIEQIGIQAQGGTYDSFSIDSLRSRLPPDVVAQIEQQARQATDDYNDPQRHARAAEADRNLQLQRQQEAAAAVASSMPAAAPPPALPPSVPPASYNQTSTALPWTPTPGSGRMAGPYTFDSGFATAVDQRMGRDYRENESFYRMLGQAMRDYGLSEMDAWNLMDQGVLGPNATQQSMAAHFAPPAPPVGHPSTLTPPISGPPIGHPSTLPPLLPPPALDPQRQASPTPEPPLGYPTLPPPLPPPALDPQRQASPTPGPPLGHPSTLTPPIPGPPLGHPSTLPPEIVPLPPVVPESPQVVVPEFQHTPQTPVYTEAPQPIVTNEPQIANTGAPGVAPPTPQEAGGDVFAYKPPVNNLMPQLDQQYQSILDMISGRVESPTMAPIMNDLALTQAEARNDWEERAAVRGISNSSIADDERFRIGTRQAGDSARTRLGAMQTDVQTRLAPLAQIYGQGADARNRSLDEFMQFFDRQYKADRDMTADEFNALAMMLNALGISTIAPQTPTAAGVPGSSGGVGSALGQLGGNIAVAAAGNPSNALPAWLGGAA